MAPLYTVSPADWRQSLLEAAGVKAQQTDTAVGRKVEDQLAAELEPAQRQGDIKHKENIY